MPLQSQTISLAQQQVRQVDTALSTLTDYIYAFDRTGRFTYANQALLTLWQKEMHEVLGKNHFELDYPPELATQYQQEIRSVLETGQTFRGESLYHGVRSFEYLFVPVFGSDGQVEAVAGSARDITERKQAQTALDEANERLKLALDAGQLGTWELDIASYTLKASATCKANFGIHPDALFTYEVLRDSIHPDDRERVQQAVQDSIATQTDYIIEYRIVWSDDSVHWVAIRGRPHYRADGTPLRLVGTSQEITERKKTEQALRHIETQFRRLLETNALGVIMGNTDGQITETNEAFLSMLGYTREELLAGELNWKQLTPPAYQPRIKQTIEELEEEGLCTPYQKEYLHKDGHSVPVYIGVATLDESGENLIAYVLDLTEQKQHEREIQALNARLRRSMTETHHRVKNNLQVISAMIEMQAADYHKEQAIPLEKFRQLKTHIHTLAIVHDLLTQSVKESEDAQRVSVKTVLEYLLPLLKQTTGDGKTLRYTLDDAALTSQQCIALSLILNELVSNALKHGDKEADVTFRVLGADAILSVSDDGVGFPEDFDPLNAANTGLELVISLIRSDLNGELRFSTRPQGGGQVDVTFAMPQETQ